MCKNNKYYNFYEFNLIFIYESTNGEHVHFNKYYKPKKQA